MTETIKKVPDMLKDFFSRHINTLGPETLGWLAIVLIHASTIPTMLALLTGLSDKTPNLDIVLFIWAGLVLLFGRAVILKDTLNIVTIGLGFIFQAVLMAMILFK